MKSILCLGISILLIGLVYFYLRQQLQSLERHVSELKSIIRMMASQDSAPELPPPEPQQELVCVSDDDTDCESASDDESEPADEPDEDPVLVVPEPAKEQVAQMHIMVPGANFMQVFETMTFRTDEFASEPALEIEEIEEISEAPKQITLTENYDGLSVKELKELVASRGGPSLKTKQQLIAFLQKNV